MSPLVKIIPWGLTVVLGVLLLNATQSLGEAKEACNARIEKGVADRERLVRDELAIAHEAALDRRDALLQDEREARLLAELARNNAENSVTAATDTIQRLTEAADNESATASQKCLRVPIDPDSLDAVRSVRGT